MRGLDPLSVGLFLMVPFWHRAGSNATHTHPQITPAKNWTVSSHANMSPAASSSTRKGGSQDNKSPRGRMCFSGGGGHGRAETAD